MACCTTSTAGLHWWSSPFLVQVTRAGSLSGFCFASVVASGCCGSSWLKKTWVLELKEKLKQSLSRQIVLQITNSFYRVQKQLFFTGHEIQMQEEKLGSLWSCTGKLQRAQQLSWHTYACSSEDGSCSGLISSCETAWVQARLINKVTLSIPILLLDVRMEMYQINCSTLFSSPTTRASPKTRVRLYNAEMYYLNLMDFFKEL